MDVAAIMALVAKGLAVTEAVWENRDVALAAVQSVKNIVEAHTAGHTVTQAQIDEVEANLDAMLDEFNSDLPLEEQA